MTRPFHENPEFKHALQRARHSAVAIAGTRDYFLTSELASILGVDSTRITELSKSGRFPKYRIVNGIAVWSITGTLSFLERFEKQPQALLPGFSRPQRVRHYLSSISPDKLAPSGTRTKLVLALLKEAPRNSAELIKRVGPRVPGIIYRLRRQGYQITSKTTFLVDEFGYPHRGVAVYQLLGASDE